MKKVLLHSLLFTGVTFLIFSCQKEESRVEDPATESETAASKISTEADAEAQAIYDGIFDDAMGVNAEVGLGGTGIFGRLTACPNVSVTHPNAPAPFPVRVVLDFGTGCVARDGHLERARSFMYILTV